MTTEKPVIMAGHIVPGKIEARWQFSFVTDKPHGQKLADDIFTPSPPVEPKSLGDERHNELLSAIKGLKVEQKTSQTVDALQRNRDWR